MFQVTIDNTTYNFPNRIEIPLWKEIMKRDFEQPHQWALILSKALGCHPKELSEVSDKQLELLIGYLAGLIHQRKETSMKDLTKLTFGEWVDLDCWFAEGVRVSIDKMLTILGDTQYSDEGLYKIEAYGKYRSYIYRQYSELFGLNYDEEDQMILDSEDGEQVDPQSIPEGWFAIIIGLASDNLLNIDDVTEQPLLKTLNFMAHQKQKQVSENFKKYKQQKEYELQRNRK